MYSQSVALAAFAASMFAGIAVAGPIDMPTPTKKINMPSITQPVVTGVPTGKLSLSAVGGLVVSGISKDLSMVSAAASAYAAVLTSATVSSNAPLPLKTDVKACMNVVQNVMQPLQSNGMGNPLRGHAQIPHLGHDSAPLDPHIWDSAAMHAIKDKVEDLDPLIVEMIEPAVHSGLTIFDDAVDFVVNGISPKWNTGIIGAVEGKTNSFDNKNPRYPERPIYPKKYSNDAPYSVPEKDLRAAIYIPPEFTYGAKKPVILFPGTGTDGGDNFAGNLIPLMLDGNFDIVWVNVPGYMLGDAQVNAEFAAYAINYISGISRGRKVGVVSWSQGGLSNQWALKYWPSTRDAVEDFIPVSGDFKGTVMAYYLCPGFPALPCDPAVLQQVYNSTFVQTLRGNTGDSAYVPTTSIYSSIFDEIVEPQTGTGASAFMKDYARHVGVTNNEVQAICPGQPAGGFYTHESILTNALAYALIIDALKYPGPGRIERIDLKTICAEFITDGLSAADYLATEAVIPQAAVNLLLYFPKTFTEPPIKPYAQVGRSGGPHGGW